MEVSVIIVNYNTARLIKQCIDSIEQHTRDISYEIIVVDNGSEAQEQDLLRQDLRYQLIVSPENLGFGRANNLGAKSATGNFLFLLNPDTILQNNAIKILHDYMKNNPECGICGGNLLDENQVPAHSFHRIFPSITSEMDFVCGQLYRKIRFGANSQFNHTESPLSVAMITGADLMIGRKVWDLVEGFDPSYFMYCEDADLCRRVRQFGYAIVNVPDSRIIHLEGKSFIETEKHCQRIIDGRNTYFRKHYSILYNWIADALNLITIACSIVIYAITGNQQKCGNMKIRFKVYRKRCTL